MVMYGLPLNNFGQPAPRVRRSQALLRPDTDPDRFDVLYLAATLFGRRLLEPRLRWLDHVGPCWTRIWDP